MDPSSFDILTHNKLRIHNLVLVAHVKAYEVKNIHKF